MIITVMTATYFTLTVLFIGMIMLNIGCYCYWRLLTPGVIISSIGLSLLMCVAGVSQFTGDDFILYASGGGCTGPVAACAARAEKIPTS